MATPCARYCYSGSSQSRNDSARDAPVSPCFLLCLRRVLTVRHRPWLRLPASLRCQVSYSGSLDSGWTMSLPPFQIDYAATLVCAVCTPVPAPDVTSTRTTGAARHAHGCVYIYQPGNGKWHVYIEHIHAHLFREQTRLPSPSATGLHHRCLLRCHIGPMRVVLPIPGTRLLSAHGQTP